MRTSFITNKEEIEQIISQCDICFVGIASGDDAPYVIPMNFGYLDGYILLHSAPEGKHISLLEKNPKVCITFCSERKLRNQHPDVACSYSMKSKSVMCRGIVSFVDNDDLDEKERLMSAFMKNYSDRTFKYSAPALRNVKVWKVRIDEITAKSFGQNFKHSN